MSLIDKALEENSKYVKNYDPTLGKRPAPKIVVVTCMDPRLSDLPGILGLPQADIDVIRTGGPAVTEDVLGELVVSNRVLGTREILLLNHTGCGFTTSAILDPFAIQSILTYLGLPDKPPELAPSRILEQAQFAPAHLLQGPACGERKAIRTQA